jgi:outer membrane lipoprotein-sorting protein
MKTQVSSFVVCLSMIMLAAPLATSKDQLEEVLEHMDRAATDFKTMTAQVTYVTHTDVINENTTETATVVMKKVQPGEVQGRVDFTSPDVKTVIFEKRKVQVYYPKIKTLQIYDLDKHGEQIDKFLMIGFGTSGTELAKDYTVKVAGTENVKEQSNISAIHLQLLPKTSEGKQYISMVELWIPEQGAPYPVREKISQPSGDYRLVTYSELKINPHLRSDALQLKTPGDVKIEHPGK